MMPVWLLRYLPHIAAVCALAAGAAWGVHKIREGVRNELEPKIALLEQTLAAERADRARAQAAADSYQAELAGLARRPRAATPVRLCRPAPVPRPEPTAEGTDGAAPAAGSGAGSTGADSETGPDIGPDLRALAAACDAENAKLRALQRWVSLEPGAPLP